MAKREKGRIDLRVDDPQQLLDMLDPYPFRERGLDGDVDEYICEHAAETAPGHRLAIAIHLPAAVTGSERALGLPGIMQRHFERQAERRSSDLAHLFALGRKMLLIGLIVLGVCLVVGQFLVGLFPGSRLAEVVMEGLVILGWVANWRPMEIFLFDWWPLVRERRLYRRLAHADISVVAYEAARPSASH
ncbi:conserved hypothetical protein [Ancylobacter novellus DSM 506]|uniref:Uncharacterized protein n=1 Tax=Ancylobacter novellus (strain ATCC 8093 / DSM 506 / JCM 20403 / CCM 1077 / IAM 12100 / NBRC 12443 / NCIMB 10456) TaxID=639283 RepID=D7A483_ANCN5|nr:hypothetical protein [Ancylobacter novellus]ADH87903.1 conserved hypothetical protein [Ancylobacter novellus DSM 506]